MQQVNSTAIYFRQVYLLAKRAGMEYGRAFQLVSQRAKANTVKSLLLRFAGSLSSGESEHEFLAQEARVESEQYTNKYQRSLETLSKWGDAYAALLVSIALIVVVGMISTMLYDMGDAFVLMITSSMFIMSLFGAYVIYKTAPFEVTAYKKSDGLGPKERRWAVFWLRIGLFAGVPMALILLVVAGLGPAILVLGLALLPAGVFAYMDDSKVASIDEEVDKFLRSLGGVAEALGTTLGRAMEKIDRRSLRTLEPYVRRLQTRLRSRISSEVCWDKFIDETGSELVNRSTRMFVHGTTMGGSPERVGRISSDFALNISLLRSQRRVRALPFAYLTIPLHGAMTGLLIFVLQIMLSFNERIFSATAELEAQSPGAIGKIPNLPAFQPKDMDQIIWLTLLAVIILTITNSLSPHFATGGHSLKLAFYGSIMCIISGVNLMIIPSIAGSLLSI